MQTCAGHVHAYKIDTIFVIPDSKTTSPVLSQDLLGDTFKIRDVLQISYFCGSFLAVSEPQKIEEPRMEKCSSSLQLGRHYELVSAPLTVILLILNFLLTP